VGWLLLLRMEMLLFGESISAICRDRTNDVGSNDFKVRGNVRVNGRLHIKGNLEVRGNVKVEKGAELIVDGKRTVLGKLEMV